MDINKNRFQKDNLIVSCGCIYGTFDGKYDYVGSVISGALVYGDNFKLTDEQKKQVEDFIELAKQQ